MSIGPGGSMTREAFFGWAEAREERYEFDGIAPVAMTRGNIGHNTILLAVHRALQRRLDDGPCRPLGLETGVATPGNGVRYPDAVVTCARVSRLDHVAPDPVVVVEVVSPTSVRTDRVVKLNAYQGVASIRAYVIVESEAAAVTLLSREIGEGAFSAAGLGPEDVLTLEAIGVSLPVAEFYEGVSFEAKG